MAVASPPGLVTVEEARLLAKRHRATIWRWIDQGHLVPERLPLDKKVYVRRELLLELIRQLPDYRDQPWELPDSE